MKRERVPGNRRILAATELALRRRFARFAIRVVRSDAVLGAEKFREVLVRIGVDPRSVTVAVPIQPYASHTGKSMVIATTHGAMKTGCMYEGQPIIFGLNAYVKKNATANFIP